MVEFKIPNKYWNYLNADIYSCMCIESYYITKIEAQLLNEINKRQCDSQFGHIPFTQKDMVVRLSDVYEFYKFLDVCYNKLLGGTTNTEDKCGLIIINNESVVPYIVRDGQKFLPLFYFDGEMDILKLKADQLKGWDLSYLKFCCKVQGTENELSVSETCSVISLMDIKSYFPPGTDFKDYWPNKVVDSQLLIPPKVLQAQTTGEGEVIIKVSSLTNCVFLQVQGCSKGEDVEEVRPQRSRKGSQIQSKTGTLPKACQRQSRMGTLPKAVRNLYTSGRSDMTQRQLASTPAGIRKELVERKRKTGIQRVLLPGSPPRKRRTLSQSLWSSIGAIIPDSTTSAAVIAASTSAAEPATLALPIICSAPPSPLHVEYAGSVASTPHSGSPRAATKRSAIPSTSSSSSFGRQRPPRYNDISSVLFYGSEEDSDNYDVDDDEIGSQPVLVPRVARMFMEEDEYEIQSTNTNLCLQWPPQPRLAAWQSKPSPESEPTPELTREPEPTTEPELTVSAPADQLEKFEFKWRAFPQAQVEPELRREPFSDIDCGPTVTLLSPYEAFTAIWDYDIMEHIAIETNRYAQQLATGMLEDGTLCPSSRITKWRDTDVSELYVYFAIILATGIVVKSRLEEYWNNAQDIFSTPGFTASMRFDRFQLLGKCLHFHDNDGCNPELMTRPEAKLYKIQPILNQLNNKFSQLYNMSQNIALDESLSMWKGWLDINQFIHNKAAAVGIKTYEVCESKTGYLWRFEVHAGHDKSSSPQEATPVSGNVPSLVLRLLDGLEHKGHTIWMDNFYNSPALARELKVRGFDCAGTLRTNRQFVPVELASLEKRDMAIGQLFGCTSGDVDIMVWRDKNRVALISTYHGLSTVKCGDTLKPSIVPDYNVCMGGVDRKDQMIAMYPLERKRNRIWYKKFFKRLLNASVLNAYILLKSQQPISHRSFRKTLVGQLISHHASPAPSSVAPSVSAGHFAAQYDFLAGKQHERQRRFCVVCSKRTTVYCKACHAPLCTFTCFELYHTSK